MSATITKLLRAGTPETLFTNLLDRAEEMEFVLVVCVQKDHTLTCHWSQLPNNLTAMGAADMLKDAVKEA